MSVYLLCFSQPLGSGRYGQARHYIGFSKQPVDRINDHQAGRGARIVQAALAAGIEVDQVRQWDGDRDLEKKLKQRKNARALCPRCSAEYRQKKNARRRRVQDR